MNKKHYQDFIFHKIWEICIHHHSIIVYFHSLAGRFQWNRNEFSIFKILLFFFSQLNEEQLYGRRILLFSYGSGLASSMYSIICRKVHDTRFTLGQIRKSIQQARDILDHERIEITPNLMDQLLLEREINDHKGRVNLFWNKKKKESISFVFSIFYAITTNGNIEIRWYIFKIGW
jgi:hypothetical protein